MEAQIEQQLEKILPEDLARTFESAYHVFQGNHEHMDDLLKNGGVLLRKAAQRFTPTQMVVGIAALAAVAVVLINRATSDDDHEGEARDVSNRDSKRQLGGKDQDKK
ncbi:MULTISPECIES: hypothetical protein [Hymenobacter]|uniref:DUF3618 domain-containing protein n=1 Tax=Hymenobacter armeniacus TaxID=2771358 RepID=A0ABR8K092_9BACT|nr:MULTISPECIES: hypothetical protein [Hymenobacter]MBD2723549.1 hypothetical protein [Hymenobacter armeniacus]MBJ6107558.1 hypothetical protein [Hymenobacter sp. BT523]